ncbi:ribosome silencing factor [Vagococcus carniphilus]|uniref:Ribosomal silencing factor RsfS n=1 Tax=Vagococcus carniphilus TaxID=218144 RepID=A0A430B7K5_9ENTE|nr:ribosome silencing factor [Vagococcus carniphilus]MDT2814095.1 ribosome silencing factor [Vagococcus carniphilus]MDT2830342.1 ribosome silencing factor [Vagococcus carniphilus]MDT2834264.1 ribosome silencing factor [Vagococcus carniphilus]MDT2840089.1 ribosome silencing factor [Vagococcus carniphilus]MDT2847922.1 ribosome silencing factor [Vagococcus carniphilus]
MEGIVINSDNILELVVKAADSKRAEDMVALNVKEVSLLADYFVVCHGNSDKQVLAIANEVISEAQKNQVEVKRVEGKESARWILIDLGDVVVHVFHSDEREFYNLEKLWSDAPLVNLTSMVD